MRLALDVCQRLLDWLKYAEELASLLVLLLITVLIVGLHGLHQIDVH